MKSVVIVRALQMFVMVAGALCLEPAHAVPSFARQTNLDCMTCHLSWPELTPTGRQFKLNGYTLGERQTLPFAAMLQASRTAASKTDPNTPDSFDKDREFILQAASLFAAGKLNEHVGIFSQWTYDGAEHHGSIDNVDLRYADHTGKFGGLSFGLTLNNNPSVQDIYNSSPAWAFPFAASPVAVTPSATTAMESLGQQVAGLGAYAMWRNSVYGELSVYRTADRAFSLLRAGTDTDTDAVLKGYNPYWRLALQHEWDNGKHSAMVGTFGMAVERFPDSTSPSGPTDRFNDLGVDAQYQYISDRHRFSLQASHLREGQHWNATAQSNAFDVLRSSRLKATYYYEKKYGVTLGWFSTSGTQDDILYNTGAPITGSANGRPDSAGSILELNYLPKRDIRFTLQYTRYSRFNGGGVNYDGLGRNASDNNTLFLLAWFMF